MRTTCCARGAMLMALAGALGSPSALAQSMSQPRLVPEGALEARIVASLPRYVPEQRVSGVISIWGHGNRQLPWMRNLVSLWEQGFRRFHPEISFDYQMWGTSSGIPSLFTGIGDVAILGEEIMGRIISRRSVLSRR